MGSTPPPWAGDKANLFFLPHSHPLKKDEIQSHKVKSKTAYITLMFPLMSDFTGAKAVGPKTSGQERTINIENYQ